MLPDRQVYAEIARCHQMQNEAPDPAWVPQVDVDYQVGSPRVFESTSEVIRDWDARRESFADIN